MFILLDVAFILIGIALILTGNLSLPTIIEFCLVFLVNIELALIYFANIELALIFIWVCETITYLCMVYSVFIKSKGELHENIKNK